MKGASLPELMVSVGIASLLTGVLVVLLTHSQILYHGEENRSDELREIDRAIRLLSDSLSQDRVYLLEPLDSLRTQKGSPGVEVEQFLETYQIHRIITFTLNNGDLIEKDYPRSEASIFLYKIEQPHSQEILGRFIRESRFRLVPPRTLEITIEGKTLKLQTQIPNIKLAWEEIQ